MSTKVIFLDVDGVLNNCWSKCEAPSGCKGLDDAKLQRLQQIVMNTGAKIVLTSTWKSEWRPNEYESLTNDGRYLVDKLKEYDLHILNKTEDPTWAERGKGILKWLVQHPSVEYFCILDDEQFDFESCDLMDYLVKTKYLDALGGLQPEHVDQAISILNNRRK